MNEEQEIRSEGKSYFAMLPHMADDDLGIYEYRLYGHYLRVCGQGGRCTEKTRTTALKLGISPGTVIKARRKLAARTPPYIRLVERKVRNFTRVDVVLCDLWPENVRRYSTVHVAERYGSSGGTVPFTTVNGTVHHGEPLKKNQYEEEPVKEEIRSLRSLTDERTNERILSLLTDPAIGMSSQKAIQAIADKHPFEDVRAFCCKFVAEQRTPIKDAGLIAYWLEAAEVVPVPTGAEEFFQRHSAPDERRNHYVPDEFADLIIR